MNDADRTLLVLAFALIALGYAACIMALELYRELRAGIRRWRVKREIRQWSASSVRGRS